ncbi:hypothetical protein [Shewanella sp. T24-MNA-CIBAN-0130]|uniref:hypothetical protein n=1 Tax=Shewanella sp. T24-MNA-CIBAN-0130 TaxID=3140470 RepID=UPI00333349A4
MARIRTVKPELFRHEMLFEAEIETGFPLRLVFVGLFTVCDREGRFKWTPRSIKLDVLPYDEVDFPRVLDALVTRGFIVKYNVSGVDYGCIPSFGRHQVINNRERASEYPVPSEDNATVINDANNINELSGDDSRVNHASTTRQSRGLEKNEGKGREGNKEGNKKAYEPEKKSIGLPLQNNGVMKIDAKQIERFTELYPDIDISQELRNMIGWFDANPESLRTRTTLMQFVNNWLANRKRDSAKQASEELDWNSTSWAEGLVVEFGGASHGN